MSSPETVSSIEDGLRALVEPGSIFEVRALKVQKNGNGFAATWSGYFDDASAAARGIAELDGEARGIYATLNPTKPELLARAANRVREVRKDDPTTTDADIASRTRLLVDVDPVRPSGISTTEAEHKLARQRAKAIYDELARIGAPDPLVVDSGNGAQLVYAIDLPADDGGLVKRALAGLAFRFDDDAVRVDTGNYNPSRIVKIAGTLTRKGDNTPERPHRRAALLSQPITLSPVPREILEAVAAWAPAPEKPSRQSTTRTADALDLTSWLDRHGIEGRKLRAWRGGIIVDIPCPMNSDHGFDAWAGQDVSGMLSAACFHATCSLKTWRDLRDRYEPRRLASVKPAPPDFYSDEAAETAPTEPEWLTADQEAALELIKARAPKIDAEVPFKWERLDTRDAINSEPRPLDWLATGLLAKGEAAVLTASTGLGKTYITLQMVIDVGVGRPVLGLYAVPRPLKILWIDEEMGLEMLNDRLTRQAHGCGLDERELELLHANLDIRYQQGLSLGDPEQFAVYDRTVREGRYDLVVGDSMVALTTGSENNADDVRAFYKRCIAPYKGSLGTAFWILAHPPKPHRDAAPGAQHDPRGSGDKINAVDRSFYLEFDSETITPESFVLKVVLNRRKMRQGGSVTGQLILIDGPEAKPVHVHSLGTLGGEKAAMELNKINTCVQDILVKLRGAPDRKFYQPQMKKDLEALGYDLRNHVTPATNTLVDQQLVKVLPPIKGAPEGRGKWLQLTKKADE